MPNIDLFAMKDNHGSVWSWAFVPSLLVSIALGGAIWMAYPASQGGESLPVISAPVSPIKVRPADPGGMKVPYQDISVLENGGAIIPH